MIDPVTKLADALKNYPHARKYLIAVSGGRDSIFLLHSLRSLGYKKLIVCHLDHSLRGPASKKDSQFVADTAARLGYSLESARSHTQEYAKTVRKSLELAARELRYAFFYECARRHGCSKIFLAHHADDQVETCLFNFMRGSGVAGLAGMRPVSYAGALELLRPMLGISREEISNHVRARGITFREDASNASSDHTRNRIRHTLIPAIEQTVGASYRAAITRAAKIMAAEEDWMSALISIPTATLSTRLLISMPLAARRRLVRKWLLSGRVPEPGFEEVERVLTLLDADHGPAKINLPGDFHARRRAGGIFLEQP